MKAIRFTYLPASFLRAAILPLLLLLLARPAIAREPAPEVRNVDPAAAEKLLAENPGVTVLDIRTPAEFTEGHIKGAVNIDFRSDDFEEKIAKLDGAKPYLIHCRSGGRSTASLAAFRKLDFRNIYHLNKGMNAWLEAGKPVEK